MRHRWPGHEWPGRCLGTLLAAALAVSGGAVTAAWLYLSLAHP